jgi:single-stranded DNA-binding protein
VTTYALVSGALFREPERRMSKAGKPFMTATIRTKDGESTQWWKLVAFSETVQAELMRLADGDAISVQGAFKVETYEKDGVTKISLSVVADHVLALRQAARKKADDGKGDGQHARHDDGRGQPFDDHVPF